MGKHANKRRLLFPLICMNALIVAIIVTSFAWFSRIRNVDMGIDFGAKDYEISASLRMDGHPLTENLLQFEDMFPGTLHKRTIEVSVRNEDSKKLMTTWFFNKPTLEEEIPYIDIDGTYGTAGYYYYLGSQIQISNVIYSIDGTTFTSAIGKGKYLITTSSEGLIKGQVNGVVSEITDIPQVEIINEIILEPDQSAIITISLEFVDNGTNQNIFQYAWASIGVCARNITVMLSEVE